MVLYTKQTVAERISVLFKGKESQHMYKVTARHMSVILARSRLRQVDQRIQANLGYIVRPCLGKQNQ